MLELTQKYYNELYGKYIGQWNMLTGAQLDRLEELLKKQNPKSLLDIGSGAGRIIEYFQEKLDCKVVGIDIDDDAIEKAKRLNEDNDKLEFHIMDYENIELPEESFDAVIAIDTLHFAEDVEKAIDNIMRVMKPGGKAYIYKLNKKVGEEKQISLHTILEQRNIKYSVEDVTEELRAFWGKAIRLADDYELGGDINEDIEHEREFGRHILECTMQGLKRKFYVIEK